MSKPLGALIFMIAVFGTALSTPVRATPAPIVFVHGIKGSFLATTDQSVRWLTAGQALGLSSPSLALPQEWENASTQKRDGLRPSGVMDEILLIPFLLRFPVYGPFLRGVSPPFYPFSYDWRRDNLETLEELEKFLSKVRILHPGLPIVLVGHSMGGLLSWAIVNRHPTWFKSVFLAGVPFAGGIGFLPDLSSGTSNGLNRRILNPQTLATFPSVYSLFPIPKSEAEINYFSVEAWSSYRIGIFKSPLEPPERKRAELFLGAALRRAKAFRQLITAGDSRYPPLHIILSRTFPTLQKAVFGPHPQIDLDTAPKCPGDGRVCEADALPPPGPPRTIHLSQAPHEALLNDKDVIDLIESSR